MPVASPERRGDAPPAGCPAFLAEVKTPVAAARTRAAPVVLGGLLVRLRREIGHEILERERVVGQFQSSRPVIS
jgi:hypothetical protein